MSEPTDPASVSKDVPVHTDESKSATPLRDTPVAPVVTPVTPAASGIALGPMFMWVFGKVGSQGIFNTVFLAALSWLVYGSLHPITPIPGPIPPTPTPVDPLPAPSLDKPISVKDSYDIVVGDMVKVEAKALGKLHWHEPRLQTLDKLPDGKTPKFKSLPYDDHAIVGARSPGKFAIDVYTSYKDQKGEMQVSEIKTIVFNASLTPPGPTPDPNPNPPGPGPGPVPPPTPPSPPVPPAPIPGDGMHVLITYESADLAKVPPATLAVLYSQSLRTYLDSKCPVGPDGKTHEWRMYDKDQVPTAESKLWQDAMARTAGKPAPWIIISNGKTGFEGPLPLTNNGADALALIKSYEPK